MTHLHLRASAAIAAVIGAYRTMYRTTDAGASYHHVALR
jgi:hypothetical protein